MFRLYFSIFWGKEKQYHHTPHESPLTMTIPLMILAFGSIFAGYIPFSKLVTSDSMPFESHLDFAIAIPSVLIGLVGILIAWILYKKETTIPERISKALGGFYQAVYHKFYIDEVYLFITKKIIFNYISRPVAWFDRHIVDGTMNGIGWITVTSSKKVKGLQSGNLPQYGMVFVLAAIVLVLIFSFLI
jgi:NADH-quinone oxidoreductase subunit L